MDKESLKKAREKISSTVIREVSKTHGPILTTDAALDDKLWP